MQEFLMQVVLPIVGTALTALATWAVGLLIGWLNTKIKNEKLRRFTTELTDVVYKAVMEVNQTFVDTLKKEGKWTRETSEIALNKCVEIIKKQCAPEILDYIGHNFSDVTDYLKSLIEAQIGQLKSC